jgi:hypothetical protein
VENQGSLPPISPLNYVLLGALTKLLISNVGQLKIGIKSFILLLAYSGLILIVFFVNNSREASKTVFSEIFISPILVMLFIVLCFHSVQDCIKVSLNTILAATCLNAFIGITNQVGFTLLDNIVSSFVSSGRTSLAYFNNDRASGLMDHPIIFGTLCALMVPYVLTSFNFFIQRLFLSGLLVSGVLLSGSRISFFLLGLVLLIGYRKSKGLNGISNLVKISLITGVGLFSVYLVQTPISQRFRYDDASLSKRVNVWRLGIDSWSEYFFSGSGSATSQRLISSIGLGISFESFIFIWIFEYGFLFTLFMLILLKTFIQRPARYGKMDFRRINLIFTFSLALYSSVGVKGQTIWVFAIFIALQFAYSLKSTDEIMLSNPSYGMPHQRR